MLAWNRAALVVTANGALLMGIGVALWVLSLLRHTAKSGSATAQLIAGRPRTVAPSRRSPPSSRPSSSPSRRHALLGGPERRTWRFKPRIP